MRNPSDDGASHDTHEPSAHPPARERVRVIPQHKPTPLDDEVWREMRKLYPKLTRGTDDRRDKR